MDRDDRPAVHQPGPRMVPFDGLGIGVGENHDGWRDRLDRLAGDDTRPRDRRRRLPETLGNVLLFFALEELEPLDGEYNDDP